MRLLTGLLTELHQVEHLPDLLLHRLDAAPAQTEGDVLEDVEVREEGVRLEDRVHRPLVRRERGHVLVAQRHGPGGRFLQAGDHAQGGGLAAAGGAEQGEEGALRHGQVERVDGGEGAVGLADALKADVAGGVCLVRHGGHAPVSFANFASNSVSSFELSERKACDLAAMALSGMISGLFAASSSIFASSAFTPSTGHT